MIGSNIINNVNEDNQIEIIGSDHLGMAAAGDYIGLPLEFIEQATDKDDSGLNKFSAKYIREPLPDPQEDKDLYELNPINNSNVKNAYKFGFVLLDHKDYQLKAKNNAGPEKEEEENVDSAEINFINTDNKTTDDTKFTMDGAATFVKHESRYQLTNDQKDYTFVAKSKNFKTLTDDYTNEIFANIPIDKPQVSDEYGTSMSNLIDAVQSVVNDKSKNPTSTYASALKYVIDNKKEFQDADPYWGQSHGNGSMFRSVITSIVAQDYEQGLELTDLMVKNTHDNPESLKGARAVYTVGVLANYGLRPETIRKIIHYMFFDQNPPDDLFANKTSLCNYDMLSHRKNIDQDDHTAVRKCDREQLEKDIKAYKYSEQTGVTATSAIRITLTAESTEEAKRWGLEAGGDCDTLLFFIMAMSSHLHGSIKSDVEKMKRIFLKTKYKKKAMDSQIEKEKNDPNAIKRIDDDGGFVYYKELNNKFNEMFSHHTRAGSKIQWQLFNILKFMNYLVRYRENSKVEAADQLLTEIFKDIRSDLDFMLDQKKKYKTEEIDPNEIENIKKQQEVIRLLSKEETDEIMKKMENEPKIHDQEIKELKDDYDVKIRMHKDATARLQNKIKGDKRKNLSEQDIQDIGKEISEINSFFQEQGVDKIPIDSYCLKTKDSSNQIFMDENESSITRVNYGGNNSDEIGNDKSKSVLKCFIGLIIWLIIIFVSFLLFCLEIISLTAAIIITVATLILGLVLMFIVSCYTKNPNDNFIKTKEFGENKIPKKTEEKIQNIKQDTIEDVKYIDD